MACGNIKIINTTLDGNVAKVSANTLAVNKLQGLETDTAKVNIDNKKHTVSVDVNTDVILTRSEAFKALDLAKQELSKEIDQKIEALDLIEYEVIKTNN